MTSEQIIRDPEVHAWVLNNSNWICESCNKPSPFLKSDGSKYLEVHHLKRLADGGTDTIENAISVCPNCHRELHYGSEKEEKLKSIYSKVKRTKKE
ncbi:MAG: HNH endonuclease [Paracoccaceae bacterium]